MLGKLSKHEFLSVGRIALPAYIVVLLLSAMGRFLTWLTSRQYIIDNVPVSFVKIMKALSSIISIAYVLVFVSLLILTLFLIVYRFYKNFFTDEGYLMMTLPARPVTLIFSKLLNAWLWIVLSTVIALLSLYITLGHYEQIIGLIKDAWTALSDAMEREGAFIEEQLGVPFWVFIAELVAFAFTYITRFIISWYASVSFGMLISKKHKIMGTVLAYLIIDVISWIIMGIYTTVITTVVPDYASVLAESSGKALQTVLIGGNVINIIFACGLYGFTAWIMRHRLNLD